MNDSASASAPVDTGSPDRRDDRVKAPFLIAILGGLVSAAVALAVAEFVAGLNSAWRSPVLDVGDRVIDAAPPFVKEFAIDTFGTNDKLALLVGIGVFLGLYALVVGFVALRHRLVLGLVGIGLFGLIGAWAANGRRVGAPWHVVLPSIGGALAGMAALVVIHRSVAARASQTTGASTGATGGSGVRRRQFLGHTGSLLGAFGVGALAFGGLGRVLGGRFTASESRKDVALPRPADALPDLPAGVNVDVEGMTPFVTPNADFYRIDTALVAPQVPTADYALRIFGMVDKEIELSYEELLEREMIEVDVTLTCVSNEIGGRLVGNARWLGTRLDDLLAEAGVQSGADQVVGRSVDGFECGFPVSVAMDGRDALLAVGMNGEPLPIEHGFPVRLVVPGLYG
ncbi:MAG: molybdopterin-dependent oxidoreductase, partial [Actinomycetota bacterium]|nr:molybdopterin-dependent oxidoreductase [Actinomycetota bacterium]